MGGVVLHVDMEDGKQAVGIKTQANLIHSGVQAEGDCMIRRKWGKQACYGQTLLVESQVPVGVAGERRPNTVAGS